MNPAVVEDENDVILRAFARAAVLIARAGRISPNARLRGARRAAQKWTQR